MIDHLLEEEVEVEDGEGEEEEAVRQTSLIKQIVQVKDLMTKCLEVSQSVRKTMVKETSEPFSNSIFTV